MTDHSTDADSRKEAADNLVKESCFLHTYGPVPSRRLGLSLGISPIPNKTCNYSCIYCQLGRTKHLTYTRQSFFPIESLVQEVASFLKKQVSFDVVTLVGEGEPTLYRDLDILISAIKKLTDKPVAIITNGALLYDSSVSDALMLADLVLPSLDAYNEQSFRKINRPHRSLTYDQVYQGLVSFSQQYRGQLWLEIMLLAGINDSLDQLQDYKKQLASIRYDRLYLNTAVRPPAEPYVQAVSHEKMAQAVDLLDGISIDLLHSEGFHSEEPDHVLAIKNIIKRHPMNQHEITGFLQTRSCSDVTGILARLQQDDDVMTIHYKGYDSYRLR